MIGRHFAPRLDFIRRPAAAQAPFIARIEAAKIGARRLIIHHEPLFEIGANDIDQFGRAFFTVFLTQTFGGQVHADMVFDDFAH